MPVVTMYRGDEFATVDTDQVPTYENFLAHGWKHDKDEAPAAKPEPEEAPATEPEPAALDAPEAAPEPPPAHAQRGRKAKAR